MSVIIIYCSWNTFRFPLSEFLAFELNHHTELFSNNSRQSIDACRNYNWLKNYSNLEESFTLQYHEKGVLKLMKWLFTFSLIHYYDCLTEEFLIITRCWFYALKMFYMKVHSYMVIQHEFIHEKLNSFRTRIHLGIRIPFNFEKAPFHFLMLNILYNLRKKVVKEMVMHMNM